MTATLSMVPLAQDPAERRLNPRTEFDDEQMAELVESVKRHGIITPLTLAPRRRRRLHDHRGRAPLPRGEGGEAARGARPGARGRRRGAHARGRRERDPRRPEPARGGARLPPARRRARRRGEGGEARRQERAADRASGSTSCACPTRRAQLIAARRVPLACAPVLVQIAEREPLLADLAAAWLAERPHDAAGFPADPGEVVDDVLAAEWTDDDGEAAAPGRLQRRRLPRPDPPARARTRGRARRRAREARRARARRSRPPTRALPEIEHASEYDWQAREARGARERDCFALSDEDADAARAFGCLLELPGPDGRREHRYVTDPEWLADRLVQKIAAHVAAEEERERARSATRAARRPRRTTPRRRRRREQRERDYEARVSARARNLDLGAALARWQPKLDTDAVKLLGSLVLLAHGKAAAWAHRLCVEQPTTTNKQGKVTVRYPRGAQAEKEHHDAGARRAHARADARGRARRRPAPARRAAARGHGRAAERRPARRLRAAGAGRLEGARQARRARRAALGQAAPGRAGGRARAARAGTGERAGARLSEQRAKLAAGEPIRCECCLGLIEIARSEAAEKDGSARPRRRLRAAMGQRRRRRRRRGGRRGSMTNTVRPIY